MSTSRSTPLRVVDDDERRARLGARHALSGQVTDTAAAARAVVCLHATEPTTVHLSAWARSGADRTQVARALYEQRIVVKQLAMRRTVFAVPTDLLPAVWGSASARVADQQHRRLARDIVAAGVADDGRAWVSGACWRTVDHLRSGPATTAELRAAVPQLQERIAVDGRAPGSPAGPAASRVITVLAATGRIVRGDNDGPWSASRPRWVLTESWLGSEPLLLSEADGYAELVRRWLWVFGPGTENDITWWLGATRSSVRRALAEIDAVPVALHDGTPAWLHPDDTEPVREAGPWVALLPALDPTTMGWHGRAFYAPDGVVDAAYDRVGNGRPTAWADGRIVGTWLQHPDGRVMVVPVVPVPRKVRSELDRRAAELTSWLDGHVIRSSLQQPTDG